MKCAQQTLSLKPMRRGCHLVTDQILGAVQKDLSSFSVGLCNIFKNADPDVRRDMETFLSRVAVPEGPKAPWVHTDEGDDDMPAHVKSSMFGCSLTIPITNGRLNLGTWQGVWLCEHRDRASGRRVVITMQGE